MRVLVFVGPSGSGKSTAVRRLHADGVVTVTPTWTTRPRRPDEHDSCVEHRFATEDVFTDLADAGFFLEVVRPFGLPFRYGLPPLARPAGGSVPAIMLRAPFVPLLHRHLPDHVVYQIEDAYQRARERVLAGSRMAGGAGLGTRLAAYEDERLAGRCLADRVFVNTSSPTALVCALVAAVDEDFPERSRQS